MREVKETQTNGTNQPDHRWKHTPFEFSFSSKPSEDASLTPLIADAFDATEPAKLTPARKACSDMSSAGRFLKKRSSSLHLLRPPFNLLVSQRGWRVGFPTLRLSDVPSQVDCQPIQASLYNGRGIRVECRYSSSVSRTDQPSHTRLLTIPNPPPKSREGRSSTLELHWTASADDTLVVESPSDFRPRRGFKPG